MKTNLLYIFADQWRAHAIGYRHEDQVCTPAMDQFAEEGKVFDHAYSTYPLCSPHRASLMTGKYPFSVGMWTNCKIGLEEKVMLKPQETCIANVLKDNEYRTAYIGKWHLDASEQNFCENPVSGAKDWDAYTPPGERRQGFDYWLSYGTYDYHLTPHYWHDSPEQICPNKWSVEYETDKVLEYLDEAKDKEEPFALFVSYNPPHLPYELVPEEFYQDWKDLPIEFRENVPEDMKTEKLKIISRQYFAAIAGIDKNFGRIMSFLKDKNMEENTLVVLSADHGEMLGSHGLMSKNIWYEESIHIPLIMRQKGRILPGHNEEIFASPDHMPTLLDLLDIEIPHTCEGYSHKKGIFGVDENVPKHMFLCSFPGSPEMVDAFSKQGLNHKCFGWRGIKGIGYTFVISNGYKPGEKQVQYFYDDRNDPFQLNPRIIEPDCHDENIKKLRELLKGYLEMNHDPFLL